MSILQKKKDDDLTTLYDSKDVCVQTTHRTRRVSNAPFAREEKIKEQRKDNARNQTPKIRTKKTSHISSSPSRISVQIVVRVALVLARVHGVVQTVACLLRVGKARLRLWEVVADARAPGVRQRPARIASVRQCLTHVADIPGIGSGRCGRRR